MLEEFITAYQEKAHEKFVGGRRPYFLPCETRSGVHCSTQFADVADNDGPVPAVTELMNRCPKGKIHAVKAIAWSTVFTLSPFGATYGGGDPCLPGDPTSADPCGGGDPCSQDVAKCGDC